MKTIMSYDEVHIVKGGAIVKMKNADFYRIDEVVKLIVLDNIYKGVVVRSEKHEIELKMIPKEQ